ESRLRLSRCGRAQPGAPESSTLDLVAIEFRMVVPAVPGMTDVRTSSWLAELLGVELPPTGITMVARRALA
ncbi:MAG: hypothetical protein QGF59_16140, partial [Pirellulaceae bacterium]|nr:hypothetical protein [Pirellulaceae bacterium]